MLIYSRRYGRLANRLWACAYLISHAHHHKYTFVNPAFSDYADLFEATSHDILCRYPVRRSLIQSNFLSQSLYQAIRFDVAGLQRLKYRKGLLFNILDIYKTNDKTGIPYDLDSDAFMKLLNSRRFLFFNGWLVRTKCLHEHADVIRSYFTPCKHHVQKIDETERAAREGCDVLIGVHVRGGDYRTWHDGKFFYEASQYAEYMRQAASLHTGKKVSFLICSDEPRSPGEFEGLKVTISSGQLVEDLYSMARCDYIISSYSTFSQWASFYGQVPLVMVHEIEGPIRPEHFRIATDCALGPY